MSKQIKVSVEVYDKLKKVSEKLNMPMAQVINYFCIEWEKLEREKSNGRS